jgi:hypothetical protein
MRVVPVLLLVMLSLLVNGCTGANSGEGQPETATASPQESNTAAKETSAPAGEGEAQPKGQPDADEDAGNNVPQSSTGDEETPPVEIDLNNPKLWQIDGFYFQMPVAAAKANIALPQEYVREVWEREDYTGMVLVGADEEQLGYRGSLLFFDGTLVAVIKYKREVVGMFEQLTNGWAALMGAPSTTPPQFTRDYEFMRRMLADERAPEYQFYWGNEELGALLMAGYDELERLSTYMLIDTQRYDELALALEDLEP